MSSNGYMDKERLLELMAKFQQGKASDEEILEIDQWYDSFVNDPTYREGLSPMEEIQIKNMLLHRVNQQIHQDAVPAKNRKRNIYRGWLVAAMLLIALAIGLYFYSSLFVNRPSDNLSASVAIVNDIAPGYNQATLTLADGSKINLDSAKAGIQINDEDIKYNDGSKVPVVMLSAAEASQKRGETRSTPLHSAQGDALLQLSTPKGGQYQITLSDGTKVWLNAASTLKYPSRFSGNRREVGIEGEAYFEVNNGSHAPFIVRSGKQEILVLGTAFNINAYEPETKTTLVSGKVQVKEKNVQLLSPGEQSVLNNGLLTKQKANIEVSVAWKSGLFYFENSPFAEVMQQISRWYDVEIIYKGKIPQKTFSGEMTRNVKLGSILNSMKGSGIQFQMDGKKLIIE